MIEQTIARLEEKLRTANLSPAQRDEVQRLLVELRAELAAARDAGVRMPVEAPVTDEESPLERLGQSVVEFETTHPKLVGIVNRISAVLANMGI